MLSQNIILQNILILKRLTFKKNFNSLFYIILSAAVAPEPVPRASQLEISAVTWDPRCSSSYCCWPRPSSHSETRGDRTGTRFGHNELWGPNADRRREIPMEELVLHRPNKTSSSAGPQWRDKQNNWQRGGHLSSWAQPDRWPDRLQSMAST